MIKDYPHVLDQLFDYDFINKNQHLLFVLSHVNRRLRQLSQHRLKKHSIKSIRNEFDQCPIIKSEAIDCSIISTILVEKYQLFINLMGDVCYIKFIQIENSLGNLIQEFKVDENQYLMYQGGKTFVHHGRKMLLFDLRCCNGQSTLHVLINFSESNNIQYYFHYCTTENNLGIFFKQGISHDCLCKVAELLDDNLNEFEQLYTRYVCKLSNIAIVYYLDYLRPQDKKVAYFHIDKYDHHGLHLDRKLLKLDPTCEIQNFEFVFGNLNQFILFSQLDESNDLFNIKFYDVVHDCFALLGSESDYKKHRWTIDKDKFIWNQNKQRLIIFLVGYFLYNTIFKMKKAFNLSFNALTKKWIVNPDEISNDEILDIDDYDNLALDYCAINDEMVKSEPSFYSFKEPPRERHYFH